MRLKKLHLENFRLFSELEVDVPDSNLVVIVGNNGAGKTSILDAIALCFTHLTAELLSKTEGYNIDSWFVADDIKHGNKKGQVSIDFDYNIPGQQTYDDVANQLKRIVVKKDKNEPGLKYDKSPDGFVRRIKNLLQDDDISAIPVIAYYNVNRTFTGEINRAPEVLTYNTKLIAYERALDIDEPNFASFEDWFIQQIRRENAIKVEKKDLNRKLPALENVRRAFKGFINEIEPDVFGDLVVKDESSIKTDFSEKIKEFLSISKHGVELKFDQLSYGERMVIGLVCDVARRLTIANDNADDALNGDGVVLIDEIDLHLHPNWQRTIVSALQQTFQNVQFIFTTHSPLVLSGIKRESMLLLNNGDVVSNDLLPDIYSATADEILDKLLYSKTSIQDFAADKKELDLIFNSMDFVRAEEKFQELKAKVGSSPKWLNDYEQRIAFAKA